MRRFPTVALAAVALLVAVALVSCGDDSTSTTDDTDSSSDDSDSTEPPATDDTSDGDDTSGDDDTSDDGPITETHDVGVYLVAEVAEPAAGGVVEAIAATTRTVDVPSDAHPGESALNALLAGPSELESDIGMTTAVPAATEVVDLTVADGVATADLSSGFEEASGAFTDVLRVAQVVFTLTTFDDVATVRFAIDGEIREVVGSHGVEVGGVDGAGIGRDDLPEARPPILLETPAPGDEVTDPLTIAGEANTFEATVQWALTDPDGEIVDEGFLTATSGSGTWGTFSLEIGGGATADRGGLGAVILWEASPEDGRQVNIVEVPVSWPDP